MHSNKARERSNWWRWGMGWLLAAGLAACGSVPPAALEPAQVQAASTAERAPVTASKLDSGELHTHRPTAAQLRSTLGTQWGEGRESMSRQVQASRLTPDQPTAVGQMRYSDVDSIRRALGPYGDRQLNALLANGDVELRVGAGKGRPVYSIFSSRGGQDYWVAGRAGERYTLIYTNRSDRYYEVVATVDGLDVLSGQPGSVKNRGYLLYPGRSLVIDGFRTSESEVATFRFSNKERAYANHTPAGDARNVGVIGTALFETRLLQPQEPSPASQPESSPPQAFPADGGGYAAPPQYRR